MNKARAASGDPRPQHSNPASVGPQLGGERRSEHFRLKVAIRLFVGVALIALLLSRGDAAAVFETIGSAHRAQLVAGVLAVLLGVATGGLRWRPFLDELGLSLPALAAVRLTLVGSFFNVFLPTGFGGDAYKAFGLRGEPGALSRAVASVLLDRWAGLVGMAVLGAAGSAVRLAGGDQSKPIVAALALAVGILVATFAVLTVGPWLVARHPEPERPAGIRAQISLLTRAIVRTGRHPRAARSGLALGLVSASFVLAGHVFLTESLDIDIPVGALASIMVVVVLIAAIPVTVNGLGLREVAYVWGLGAYGVDRDVALAFALLVLGALLACSLIGGVLYLVGGAEVFPRTKPGLSRNDEKA